MQFEVVWVGEFLYLFLQILQLRGGKSPGPPEYLHSEVQQLREDLRAMRDRNHQLTQDNIQLTEYIRDLENSQVRPPVPVETQYRSASEYKSPTTEYKMVPEYKVVPEYKSEYKAIPEYKSQSEYKVTQEYRKMTHDYKPMQELKSIPDYKYGALSAEKPAHHSSTLSVHSNGKLAVS